MSTVSRIEISRLFEGIAAKMLVDFDEIQSRIPHTSERGIQREQTLKVFLERYLPHRYALGSGHIVDTNGNISNQCDIVIYDAHNGPLLLAEDGYQVFPIETVFGVIEVKSALQSSTIKEAVENITAVKKLDNASGIVGSLFAYKSTYRNEPRIEAAGNSLIKHLDSVDRRHWVDVACVLTDGVIECQAHLESGEDLKVGMLMYYDLTTSTLLYFLATLIRHLEEKETELPDLVRYGSGPELRGIGYVKLLEL